MTTPCGVERDNDRCHGPDSDHARCNPRRNPENDRCHDHPMPLARETDHSSDLDRDHGPAREFPNSISPPNITAFIKHRDSV
jgi:hypothetical protein